MVAMSASALMNGIVKAVPSGDTIVVMKQAAPVHGPPPEMRLTLSSLKAPLLSRDGTSDEPFAWASREYLRQKLIGRPVAFHIDYRVQALSRVFATVTIPAEGVNVNDDVVAAGMARVRRPAPGASEGVSPDLDSLIAAEDRAQADRVGLHAGGNPPDTRTLPGPESPVLEGESLVSLLRGMRVRGIVDYVANGSAIKVLLRDVPHSSLDDRGDRLLTLCLSGVQCPGFRRPEGADPSTPPKPMPFALNARFLTEIRLLHREVNISVEGLDRNGMMFATVIDPKAKLYIGEELLRAGYAKTVGWSLDLSSRAPALRAAERFGRDRQAGVWKGFKPTPSSTELFTGKCVEVVSGDMIAVLDDSSGDVRRISLASVRAARAERPSRDRSTMPVGPAADAKEALRKKLVGRRVRVKVEYIREPGPDAVRKDNMTFATISREGDSKNPDIAIPLISSGLLSVVRHRGDEDRAANYETYLEREAEALEAKRGLHNPNAQATTVRINNLTGPDAKRRSRDVLAGLQRGGPYKGIVEFISSASRYRIFLPSESMLITVALRAVRCPQSTRRSYAPDGSIRDEVPGEPHGDESAEFARERFMQRDVEVEISNVDRVGAFLGNLWAISGSGEKTDVSHELLANGHGYLHESFDPSSDRGGSRYLAVEKEAKEAKRGVWSDYVEAAPVTSSTEEGKGALKPFRATVSEIGFGGRIFVQNRDTCTSALAKVESALASMSLDSQSEAPQSSLKPGLIVAAKFSVDNRWYRARVLFVHKGEGVADVRFIDYGNEQRVASKDIRRLGGSNVGAAGSVAVEVGLAHVIVPGEDDPCGVAAGEFLRDLVYGNDVTVTITSTEGPSKVFGDLLVGSGGAGSSDGDSNAPTSVREQMLRTGLARLVRKKDAASRRAFKELRPLEEVGIKTRQYLWNYGEAFESDCDDEVAN